MRRLTPDNTVLRVLSRLSSSCLTDKAIQAPAHLTILPNRCNPMSPDRPFGPQTRCDSTNVHSPDRISRWTPEISGFAGCRLLCRMNIMAHGHARCRIVPLPNHEAAFESSVSYGKRGSQPDECAPRKRVGPLSSHGG